MKPWIHAENSTRKFGGIPQDYIAIHNFFDESKAHHADMRHRALLHNSFGIFLAERLFGYNHDKLLKLAYKYHWTQEMLQDIKQLIDDARSNDTCTIKNNDGDHVSIRDIGEQHVIEDMGCIPSVSDYLTHMPMIAWLGGGKQKPNSQLKKEIKFDVID